MESSVANQHALGKEYRAFIAIDMVHELDLLSRDSIKLTLTRTELGSELTKFWDFEGFSKNMCVDDQHRVNSSLSTACEG